MCIVVLYAAKSFPGWTVLGQFIVLTIFLNVSYIVPGVLTTQRKLESVRFNQQFTN